MNKKLMLSWLRIGFAALVLAAVYMQFLHGVQNNPAFKPTNFFSFFTIESNILAALIFLVVALVKRTKQNSKYLDYFRGAATLYMVITGLVYSFLLTGIENQLQTPVPWINAVLHYIFPAVVLIDWLIDPPQKATTYKRALLWLIFPLLYFGYSLVRGHFAHWYPYPFLNVDQFGYAQVALNSVVIAGGAVFLCLTLVTLSKLRSSR